MDMLAGRHKDTGGARFASWKKRARKGNCAAEQRHSQTLRRELTMILPEEAEAGSAGPREIPRKEAAG
jgi:hypothetical protein